MSVGIITRRGGAANQFIQATGGTVTDITQNGVNYRVHTFTSSGTFTVNAVTPVEIANSVEYLVVGGGGGTALQGGGGAGGFLTGADNVEKRTYAITVGAGGSSGNCAVSNGEDSVFEDIATAIGGGRGGSGVENCNGADGGSGGGGGSLTGTAGGSGTAGQGNDGGTGDLSNAGGAGGGGGGGAGQQPGVDVDRKHGGDGLSSDINGTLSFYAGGGGTYSSGTLVQPGGLGGGADGASGTGASGEPNTGGGAGGAEKSASPISSSITGGSGIVIIRYRIA